MDNLFSKLYTILILVFVIIGDLIIKEYTDQLDALLVIVSSLLTIWALNGFRQLKKFWV